MSANFATSWRPGAVLDAVARPTTELGESSCAHDYLGIRWLQEQRLERRSTDKKRSMTDLINPYALVTIHPLRKS